MLVSGRQRQSPGGGERMEKNYGVADNFEALSATELVYGEDCCGSGE